jgi:hypothetical protein
MVACQGLAQCMALACGHGHRSPACSRRAQQHGRLWLAGVSGAPAGAPRAPPWHGTPAATSKPERGGGREGVSTGGRHLTSVRRALAMDSGV